MANRNKFGLRKIEDKSELNDINKKMPCTRHVYRTCPNCGKTNKITLKYFNPPPFVKCMFCRNELKL